MPTRWQYHVAAIAAEIEASSEFLAGVIAHRLAGMLTKVMSSDTGQRPRRLRELPTRSCAVGEGEITAMRWIDIHHNEPADGTSDAADVRTQPACPPPPNLGPIGGGVLQPVSRPRVFAKIDWRYNAGIFGRNDHPPVNRISYGILSRLVFARDV